MDAVFNKNIIKMNHRHLRVVKCVLFPSSRVLFGFLILVFYFKQIHEERRRLMHNL